MPVLQSPLKMLARHTRSCSETSSGGTLFHQEMAMASRSHHQRGAVAVAVAVDTESQQPYASDVTAKRIDLEKEVENLSARLRREEEVRRVLEMAANSKNGTILSIPVTLPKKVKELLSELAMVEGEISRLESQISKIRQEAADSQEARHDPPETKAPEPIEKSPAASSTDDPPDQVDMKLPKKIAFETKPLFFLNQAIRGDGYFGFHAFAPVKAESAGGAHENSTATVTTTANKGNRKPAASSGPRWSRKIAASGPAGAVAEKQQLSSPRLPPLHPVISTALQSHDHGTSPRSPTTSLHLPVSPQNTNTSKHLQPNRLSENIIKCLICIYLRLMRATRAKEHEKLGAMARSASGPLAVSFKADGTLNLNASLLPNKDTKQQDPYGIFAIEGSVARDIGPYKNLIVCNAASLDFKDMPTCIPLVRKLRALLNNLRQVDLSFSTHQQQLAFWINMYNSCIMHGFLEHGLPSHPEKILSFRSKATLTIGGHDLSASTIENTILRQLPDEKDLSSQYGMDTKENDIRKMYSLEHAEPNISFALCCGTKSSPAVKIYTAENVSTELEKAKLEYLQASVAVISTGKLMIPNLLVRNMNGFAMDLESLIHWVCSQLPSSGSLRKSMAACMRGRKHVKISPYELDFQYLLPM